MQAAIAEVFACCCFVIYSSREEADKAMTAYHNKRTLPAHQETCAHYRFSSYTRSTSEKELVREQVFVLGRMGNAKEPLSTIINKLEDINIYLASITASEVWSVYMKDKKGYLVEFCVGDQVIGYIHKGNIYSMDVQIARWIFMNDFVA
ncbi:hypothetical protein ZEAMMB73_Zm00001d019020 [Zea mays]|uniref:Uncharacterized protein n=1 Tax=Zea mays TaxID=4577 RepID=A0A1D6HUD0_MAIZE|nr:hypothetical protein ZEAMMB73_Zm00001d019020 [Zea mays]